MNRYDTKIISCGKCGKCIVEVDYEAKVIRPLCGMCANSMTDLDSILSTISSMKSNVKIVSTMAQ